MAVYYYWDQDTKQFDSTVISDKEIRDANATTDSLVGLCQPIYRDTEIISGLVVMTQGLMKHQKHLRQKHQQHKYHLP